MLRSLFFVVAWCLRSCLFVVVNGVNPSLFSVKGVCCCSVFKEFVVSCCLVLKEFAVSFCSVFKELVVERCFVVAHTTQRWWVSRQVECYLQAPLSCLLLMCLWQTNVIWINTNVVVRIRWAHIGRGPTGWSTSPGAKPQSFPCCLKPIAKLLLIHLTMECKISNECLLSIIDG